MIDNRNAGDVYSQAFDKLPRRRLMGKGKTFNKKGYSVENGLTEEKKKRKVKSSQSFILIVRNWVNWGHFHSNHFIGVHVNVNF